MKRIVSIIVTILLLAVIAVICVVRWNAWFTMPQPPVWEGDSIASPFHTMGATSELGQDTLRIVLFGDVHNDLTHDQLLTITHQQPSIDGYAQLGDLFERLYPYYEQQNFQAWTGTVFEQLPILAIPGNHEYTKGIVPTLPEHWYALFPYPNNGPLGNKGSSYYVDFPHLRVIALDTYALTWISDYTRANFWLKRTIKEAPAHVMVMMHQPIHSHAHRYNPLVYSTFIRAIQGADVVFSGHDHICFENRPFIGINSSAKHYTDLQQSAYALITATADTLMVETYPILMEK